MLKITFHRFALGLIISLLLVSTLVLWPRASAAASSFTFKNFELSSVPGTRCPNTSRTCTNGAAEPAIRADKEGHFYASSENGLGAGTDAWQGSTNGLHYATLVPPNPVSSTNNQGFAPGGGDTDLAVAPIENANHAYNVYVASLSGADVNVSTSQDEGKTWTIYNPTSATIPGDDREWIAADGASKVCISYRTLVGTQLVVNCSYDAGATFTQVANVFDTNHAAFAVYNARIGNLAIDPNNHYIYQTFAAVKDNNEAINCTNCNLHVVWMGVSTDGGKTFTDYPVYINPDVSVSYGHQFTNVSVDRAGNVYSVYSDDHNVYYSFSTDHGQTWSGPFQVNQAPSNTAIFPWSVANKAGHIDIVWYGTSYYDGINPPDNYPMSAAWYAYMAQNLSATTAGSSFTQVAATPIIHYGGVCEGGVTCSGNRDLYDDFGVAVNLLPGVTTSGFASIVYSDDQYTNDPNNPPQAGCTATTSNQPACDHTSIATQTSGTGI